MSGYRGGNAGGRGAGGAYGGVARAFRELGDSYKASREASKQKVKEMVRGAPVQRKAKKEAVKKIKGSKRMIIAELEKVVTTLATKYRCWSAGAILEDSHYPLKQAIRKCTTEMDSLDRFLDSTKSELGSANSGVQKKFLQLKSLVDDLEQVDSLPEFSISPKTPDHRIKKLVMILKGECSIKNVDDSMDVDQIEAGEALARYSAICGIARQLANENCSNAVAVNEKAGDDSVNNFFAEFDMKLNLNVKTEKGQKPVQEYGLPKRFQFRQCLVSKNTKEFVDMIVQVVEEIISTECPATCGKLLEAVHSAVNVYIFTYGEQNDEKIKTNLVLGALFYNGCYYIAHVLMLESLKLRSTMYSTSRPVVVGCGLNSRIWKRVMLHDLVPLLSNFADQILETHLLELRRQISSIIGTDSFANLMREGASLDYQKVLTSCLNTIRQVADVWRPVFSEFVYARSVGACISYTLAVLVDVIVCKEDITEKDSQEMKNQLNHLLAGFEQIMKINNEKTIRVFCEKDYYRAKEAIFCLNEPSGKGRKNWIKPDEVKKLIRAVFQNTDL